MFGERKKCLLDKQRRAAVTELQLVVKSPTKPFTAAAPPLFLAGLPLIYVFLSSSHTESFHAMQWRAQPSRTQLVIKLLWQCYMTCDHMTGYKLRKSESDELCHRGVSDDWWRWRWQGSHVPTWQLASTASGLTLATHCTGLQMKCKFCKISQKICTTLCNCASALHCIFSTACGALGGGRYVLVKRNYTQWRGIMQRDRCAEFFLHEVCIVSWPWAWAAGGPMIVITVHPITWPTHPPSRPSTNVQCNAMQMQLNTLQ